MRSAVRTTVHTVMVPDPKENKFKRLYNAVVAVAAIALLYAFLSFVGIGCPIKYLTGVSCPGCGMTRAWKSVLYLDFAAAFSYHPLWILPVPGVFLLLFKDRMPKWVYRLMLGLIIVAFLVVYAIRMASGDSEIVVFRPSKGLIGRAVRRILA